MSYLKVVNNYRTLEVVKNEHRETAPFCAGVEVVLKRFSGETIEDTESMQIAYGSDEQNALFNLFDEIADENKQRMREREINLQNKINKLEAENLAELSSSHADGFRKGENAGLIAGRREAFEEFKSIVDSLKNERTGKISYHDLVDLLEEKE